MDHREEDLIPKELLSPYLKRVMKGSIVYIKEALCQRHHGAKAVPPQHLLGQVGTSRLARHPCAQMERTRKVLQVRPTLVFIRAQCLEKLLLVAVNWTHCVSLCLDCLIQVRADAGAAVPGFYETAAAVLI